MRQYFSVGAEERHGQEDAGDGALRKADAMKLFKMLSGSTAPEAGFEAQHWPAGERLRYNDPVRYTSVPTEAI